MPLLEELFKQLDAAPEAGGTRQTCAAVGATCTPTAHDHPPVPAAPARAAERPAEARRNAWTITREGRPICTVCGVPMTCDEALVEARWRWSDADILEN